MLLLINYDLYSPFASIEQPTAISTAAGIPPPLICNTPSTIIIGLSLLIFLGLFLLYTPSKEPVTCAACDKDKKRGI